MKQRDEVNTFSAAILEFKQQDGTVAASEAFDVTSVPSSVPMARSTVQAMGSNKTTAKLLSRAGWINASKSVG